jgi:hypothetical protein
MSAFRLIHVAKLLDMPNPTRTQEAEELLRVALADLQRINKGTSPQDRIDSVTWRLADALLLLGQHAVATWPGAPSPWRNRTHGARCPAGVAHEAGGCSVSTITRRSPWAGLKRELSEWRQAATAWNRQALETHRRVQALELEVRGLRAEVLDLNLRALVAESRTDDLRAEVKRLQAALSRLSTPPHGNVVQPRTLFTGPLREAKYRERQH